MVFQDPYGSLNPRLKIVESLDEVLALCQLDERLIPCVDFGHLYARSLGADDGAEAMERILDRMARSLGEERVRQFHSHFSHIEFTPGGGSPYRSMISSSRSSASSSVRIMAMRR